MAKLCFPMIIYTFMCYGVRTGASNSTVEEQDMLEYFLGIPLAGIDLEMGLGADAYDDCNEAANVCDDLIEAANVCDDLVKIDDNNDANSSDSTKMVIVEEDDDSTKMVIVGEDDDSTKMVIVGEDDVNDGHSKEESDDAKEEDANTIANAKIKILSDIHVKIMPEGNNEYFEMAQPGIIINSNLMSGAKVESIEMAQPGIIINSNLMSGAKVESIEIPPAGTSTEPCGKSRKAVQSSIERSKPYAKAESSQSYRERTNVYHFLAKNSPPYAAKCFLNEIRNDMICTKCFSEMLNTPIGNGLRPDPSNSSKGRLFKYFQMLHWNYEIYQFAEEGSHATAADHLLRIPERVSELWDMFYGRCIKEDYLEMKSFLEECMKRVSCVCPCSCYQKIAMALPALKTLFSHCLSEDFQASGIHIGQYLPNSQIYARPDASNGLLSQTTALGAYNAKYQKFLCHNFTSGEAIKHLKDFCENFQNKANVDAKAQEFYGLALLKFFSSEVMSDDLIVLALAPLPSFKNKALSLEVLQFLASYKPKGNGCKEVIASTIWSALKETVKNTHNKIFEMFKLYRVTHRLPISSFLFFANAVHNKIESLSDDTVHQKWTLHRIHHALISKAFEAFETSNWKLKDMRIVLQTINRYRLPINFPIKTALHLYFKGLITSKKEFVNALFILQKHRGPRLADELIRWVSPSIFPYQIFEIFRLICESHDLKSKVDAMLTLMTHETLRFPNNAYILDKIAGNTKMLLNYALAISEFIRRTFARTDVLVDSAWATYLSIYNRYFRAYENPHYNHEIKEMPEYAALAKNHLYFAELSWAIAAKKNNSASSNANPNPYCAFLISGL